VICIVLLLKHEFHGSACMHYTRGLASGRASFAWLIITVSVAVQVCRRVFIVAIVPDAPMHMHSLSVLPIASIARWLRSTMSRLDYMIVYQLSCDASQVILRLKTWCSM